MEFIQNAKKWIIPLLIVLLVLLLLLLVLFSIGIVPRYSGTLETIYQKSLKNVKIEKVSMIDWNKDLINGNPVELQNDHEMVEALKNYLFSLHLRSKYPQTYTKEDSEIYLRLFEPTVFASVALSITIIDNSIIVVHDISHSQVSRKLPHVFIVKEGIDIDFIRSCFDEV